ncbi:outer membrane beta-barrel protein [Flavobacterium sp. 140616W15]|uniref:outer membrane beta-barrel protein n=1 Tax=Flavobacterium sp. 140616W15 TaxID=2478552 RepID=UPI000F0CF461|nr:outer membrane beta-barrel protein [Flavobacterium sp. 140616W15]AYN03773.1 hypothetical protein EAG11_05960 [Flavobacterium sp. 140616W15]
MKKRLLLSIFASLSFILTSQAQEKGSSDLSVNIGFATSTELSNLFTDILVSGLTGNQIKTGDIKAGPTLGITYRYAIANRWMVQADGFYQKMSQDIYVNNTKEGKANYTYITVGLGTDYRYISTNFFQMYSGVAVGYTSENIKNSGAQNSANGDGFINYQVNALGFRVGKKFAAFAELGFGYKGIVNTGVSYQF